MIDDEIEDDYPFMFTEMEDGKWACQRVTRPHMEVVADTQKIGHGILTRFSAWWFEREDARIQEAKAIIEADVIQMTKKEMVVDPDQVMNHSVLEEAHYMDGDGC